jgi:aminoglycoside 6'-N-acetyltransferase
VRFRPLTRADFPLLRTWLEEPVVARWWNHETTDAALERDFGPSLDGADPAELFVALDGDEPFGYAQRYPIAATPEYAEELGALCALAPGALSIDYLIGVPGRRGRGLGAAMIAAFVTAAWAAYPDAPQIVVPVAAGNVASWRALERAGFERVAEGELEPDNPIDPPDHVVYAIGRP